MRNEDDHWLFLLLFGNHWVTKPKQVFFMNHQLYTTRSHPTIINAKVIFILGEILKTFLAFYKTIGDASYRLVWLNTLNTLNVEGMCWLFYFCMWQFDHMVLSSSQPVNNKQWPLALENSSGQFHSDGCDDFVIF